ncbi:neuraminidase-like domain-containing protein [Amaricoccus sp. W119]|uniref:Tc toxin subunit A-related protein n=1 Tax=Amaricoccus sp. W119 TaxID=3391833 RepID=UPI0039A64B9F
MNPIEPPIRAGDTGESVANLRRALLFLLERPVIRSFDSPNQPTADELAELFASIRAELETDEPFVFGGGTQRALFYLQVQQGLGDHLYGFVDDTTAALLNALLLEFGAFERVVSGHLSTPMGRPVPAMLVIAYDRDLFDSQQLGSAITDPEGGYWIAYRLEQAVDGEGRPVIGADLEIRALAADGAEPLAVSPVRFNAGAVETIDLVVPVADPGPVEFVDVSSRIVPMLGDRHPEVLTAEHIDFIAGDTGLTVEAVRAWVSAALMHLEARGLLDGRPPEFDRVIYTTGWAFFFAVLRATASTDLDRIIARGRAAWEAEQSLAEAVRRIRVLDDAERNELMEALSLLARLVRIDWRRPSPTPLALVLADAPLPRPMALQALDIYDQTGLGQADAFRGIEAGTSDEFAALDRFILALRLRATLGPDPGFSQAVKAELGDVADPQSALAEWSVGRWREVLSRTGIAEGPLTPDSAHARAIELQLKAEQAMPLPALVQRLTDVGTSLKNPALQDLPRVLPKYGEQAKALLDGKPVVVDDGSGMPHEHATMVRNLGRYLGMGVTLEGGLALIDQRIPSPGAAMNYGSQAVKQALGSLYPPAVVTGLTETLEMAADAANGFVASIATQWSNFPLFVTSGISAAQPQADQTASILQNLLGSHDGCACRPCESVLSLSAYLVDLLNLLKTAVKTGTTASPPETAQSELRTRRPDIFQLDLGCEAAEKEVLHIDLAIEAMERELGTSPGAQLANAPYPWNLPFDRNFAELRLVGERLGLERSKLLELMATAPADDVAASTLGIAQTQSGSALSEWALITTPRSGDELADAWGIPRGSSITIADPDTGTPRTGSVPTVLGRASVLLERAGLELDELDSVLATRYLGGLALSNRQQCKTSDMTLSGQPEAVFDRLHRFVRLRRKLQAWSVPLVDSALQACALPTTGRGTADYVAALRTLGAAERVRVALNLPPEIVLAMRLPLDDIRLKSEATGTLFAHEFGPLASAIANGDTITDNFDLVAGALGCDSRDLAMLIATTGAPMLDQVSDVLNSANLTWLYRHVHLARALQVSVPQLVQLKLATAIDPFEVISTTLTSTAGFERLLAIHDAAARIAASGWSVEVATDILVPASTLAKLANRLPGLDVAEVADPALVMERLVALQTALRRAASDAEASRSAAHVERALQPWIGNEAAGRVMTALVAASAARAAQTLGTVPDAAAVALLSASTRPEYSAGNFAPLFSAGDAANLLKPNAGLRTLLSNRLNRLSGRLAERERERRLGVAVQGETGLPVDLVDLLLTSGLPVVTSSGSASPARQALLAEGFWRGARASDPPPAVDVTARPDLHEWMVRLHKLAALVRAGGEDTSWLSLSKHVRAAGAAAAGIDWSTVIAPRDVPTGSSWAPRWDALSACVDVRALLDLNALAPATVKSHFHRLAAGTGALSDTDLQPLCIRLDVAATELRELAKLGTGAVSRETLAQPTALLRLLALAQLLRRAGATAAQATGVLATDLNSHAAQVLRQLAETQGGSDVTLAKIADSCRMLHRDAAVALLLHKKGWRSADRIFEHCLIDPLVQPCLNTTATLQAVAAVQLFIQLLLYGRESDFTGVEKLRRRWTWMRSYRIWEANRKVFLFPENWLFPELRDDKSSSFRLLEADLGQGELNGERAREAFGAFLDDVVQMSDVQVLGMYDDATWDTSSTPPKRTHRDLYVVGRSANPPYLYYWRRCVDFGGTGMEWSGWQRIELDIQGDHLLPFVNGGALWLAWPVLTERESSGDWQLSFDWSRLDVDGWRRAESARVPKDLAPVAFVPREEAFTFRCLVEPGGVRIGCFALPAPKNSLTNRPTQEVTYREDELDLTVEWSNIFKNWCNPFSHSGVLPSSVIVDGQITIVERLRIDQVSSAYISAIHRIFWECWIKAKSNDGKSVGYIKISSDPGGTANPRFILRSLVGREVVRSVGIGQTLGLWSAVLPGSAYSGSIPEVTCFAQYTLGSSIFISSNIPVPATPKGKFCRTDIRMVIEPRAGEEPSLAELGVSVPADLKPVASFVLPETGKADWEPGNLPMPAFHRGTLPFMNGMQADVKSMPAESRNSWPLVLPKVPPQFNNVVPAAGSSSDAQTWRDYWLLPVSDQPVAQRGSTAWYYREGKASAFLDVHTPLAASAHVDGYAASFPEARSIRRDWNQSLSLDAPAAQSIAYGANLLPAPINTMHPKLWQDQVSGASSFDLSVPNACYGWEVFFHAPLIIADQLSKQQRFEESERWLRMLFDPTSGGVGSDPKRFLKFRVFKELDPRNDVTNQLKLLAQAAAGVSAADVGPIKKLVERWRDLPFRPFAIARRRHVAFLWRTLFAYLDNLLAWADSLYRQDRREAISEATLLYVLAARLLGTRPKLREKGAQRPARTYDSMQGDWDDFGNLWIDASIAIDPNLTISPRDLSGLPGLNPRWTEQGWPRADGFLFFCLPHNDKLFSYWNMIESRLFNIRHCRNIDGIERQLPLLDPSIDVELLVRATAAGLDLGQVIAGLYAPPPHYRFSVLAARASELAAETRTLGGALLAAIEKRDAERLSQLRSTNELAMLERVEAVRLLQIDEAEANVAALRATRELTESRYEQYQRLIGREGSAAPSVGASRGEESMLGRIESGASAGSNLGLIEQESKQIEYVGQAYGWSLAAGVAKGSGGAAHMTSSIVLAAAGSTDPGKVAAEILKAVGTGLSTTGDMFELVSRGWQHGANHEGLMAGHTRRRDEWAFQSNQALRELRQIDRQILANEIRISIAKKELENQQLLIDQTQSIDDFLHDKFSNVQLYDWMVQQLAAAHLTAYRLARELALRAQAAAERELGGARLNVIGNAHWDGLRGGLLAGERLHQEVKRLEVTFLDRNVREHEMTKHISLRRLCTAPGS